ncbi:ANKRD44 [Symbiodinium natans]|uniref:ANKRD44 protein n=1 Tax=Symbiodinium natans TaxID=878477 RepID=A0A812K3Z3_9DINO|nr:ANKRD44 [Symbiodinium natans]
MACCSGQTSTPLEKFSRSLPDDPDVSPMLCPMYTVTVDVLLKMTSAEPHEDLKARGDLVVFSDEMGRAVFVSHQWLSKNHPDPDFKQTRILQDAVRRLMIGRGSVSLDPITEGVVRSAKPIPMQAFVTEKLFFWYDYFSCPQRESETLQANAINSIPAYIARCSFFFALCPVVDCPFEAKVLTPVTWSSRGWCRLERAARELSRDSSWILIQNATSVEVVGTALSFPSLSVGEGDFAIDADRQKLAKVMRRILVQKLYHCLRVGDLPGFRRHFNLQTVHLRGLEIEPVEGFLPSCDDSPSDPVDEFLHQNGLRKINKADSAGWRPLHYAALAGNVEVLRGLLEKRADVNGRTAKDEPQLGFPLWMSALDLTAFFKHHKAMQFLLSARANLHGGLLPTLQHAAIANNAEGVRLLCAAGGKPLTENPLGSSSLHAAATFGGTAALHELVVHGRPVATDLSLALFQATNFRGGAATVQRLIDLRADVDFQMDMGCLPRLGRLLFATKSLQHKLGWSTVLATGAYHMHGSTPLMQAIRSAQYEAAATLIAAGARLDLRNSRNWTARDFASGQWIPDFLKSGLEGNPVECKRVSGLALEDGYVHLEF